MPVKGNVQLFWDTIGVHHGGLQYPGPVAWLPVPRVGLCAALDSWV